MTVMELGLRAKGVRLGMTSGQQGREAAEKEEYIGDTSEICETR